MNSLTEGRAAPLTIAPWLLLLLLGCLTVPGCGSACLDLQDICDLCQDPNHKARCEQAVDEGVQDICEQDIDSYEAICR